MQEKEKYFLRPGYIIVSRKPYLIHTVLGSCISVCIWDVNLNFGGMNHYIYSGQEQGKQNAQYGNVSTTHLLRLMRSEGSNIKDLKAHVVGGAQNPAMSHSTVGEDNIRIAEEILKKQNIQIVTKDVGGTMGRKVIFDNITGEILVYKVNSIRKGDWYGED